MKKTDKFMFVVALLVALVTSVLSGSAEAMELVQSFQSDQWKVDVYSDHTVVVNSNEIVVLYNREGVDLIGFGGLTGSTAVIEQPNGERDIYEALEDRGYLLVNAKLGYSAFTAITFNDAILVNDKFFDTSGYMKAINQIKSF